MALSEVSICNLALSHLGLFTITALTDNNQEARKCALYFDYGRDFVLRDFPWNFAEKRLSLTEDETIEPIGYDFAYVYPTDCIDARLIYNEVAGGEPIKFVINVNEDLDAKHILTNEEDAILIYTARVEDVTLFDPSFDLAFSYYLASLLAIPLTGDPSKQQAMIQIYSAYMNAAEAANASESESFQEVTNPFIAARG